MQVILGTKIGMTQIIGEDGVVTPVTILQAGPCTVTQIKTVETDGYNAVQVGYGQGKNLSKSVSGHVKKAGENINPKVLMEFRVEEFPEGLKLGDNLTVESFKLGDKVAVTGTSKGKGYAGTVKRHNFNESRNTHGFKGNIRRVGSIGSMYPQKVFKGKKMPGQYGNEQVTVLNLKVVKIDAERNLIAVKGAVPGAKDGIVFLRNSVKA
jgi:large subunit ribosomal protein L3